MKHDELVPVILELIEKGYSRGQIAQQLGMTRNAVIGLAWRRKLPQATPEARLKAGQPVVKHSGNTVVEVLRLHREGLTAPAIGQKLGLTESQVSGLIYRHRNKDIAVLELNPTSDAARTVASAIRRTILVSEIDAPEGKVTVFNVTPRQCRYICDDGYFCGADKKSGSAFCAEHHAVCYVSPKGKKKHVATVGANNRSAVSIRASAHHAVHF